MNGKKSKALRRAARLKAWRWPDEPEVPTKMRPYAYWPAGSYRRIYQDSKGQG